MAVLQSPAVHHSPRTQARCGVQVGASGDLSQVSYRVRLEVLVVHEWVCSLGRLLRAARFAQPLASVVVLESVAFDSCLCIGPKAKVGHPSQGNSIGTITYDPVLHPDASGCPAIFARRLLGSNGVPSKPSLGHMPSAACSMLQAKSSATRAWTLSRTYS